VDKLLADALITLSVVVSDPFGASGRPMMAALIAGERDPAVLADLARGRLRAKTTRLTEALTGRFTDHHALLAFLLTQMLHRIDGVSADIATVRARIDARLGEPAPAVARLDAIPGIGPVAAQMIPSEIGTDLGRFPTPAHLASRARFPPGVSESAGRPTGKAASGNGNRYLARILGEAAVSAAHPSVPPTPTPSSVSATGASPAAAARSRRSWRSAAPSSSSSGRCSPTTTSSSSTSARTTTTPASTRSARCASTSANSRPSATR
jgi:hypothetical protein